MTGHDGVPLEAWDTLSEHYDRQRWLEHSAIATTVDLLEPQPHERVLDVATGTGQVLRRLAARPDRPRQVVGVDQSAGMLSHVPALPTGWSVQQADARELPFPDAHFHAAVASYVLHLLAPADRARALSELRRVLRPAGRVATSTPAIPPRGPARPLAWGLDRLAARRPARYGGLRALDVRPALVAAGFTVVAARWDLRGYPTLCVLARAVPPPASTDRTSTPAQNAIRPFTRRASGDGCR